MPIRLTTYRKGNSIPALPGYTIFNSTELFRVYELTRGYEPILIVAYLEERPKKRTPFPTFHHQAL